MSKKAKAPKQHVDTRQIPNGIVITVRHDETVVSETEVYGGESQQCTLAEEIAHFDFCLSDDWSPSFAKAYKAKAVEAAFRLDKDNRQQRDWLIEHSALRKCLCDDRQFFERDADVWITLMRAKIALNEGREDEARRLFHKARKLRDTMGAAMPETRIVREARINGGNEAAKKHLSVMEYCAELILGPSITKANLATQIALATKLAPAVSKYIRDHPDELKGSQLANHAGKNLTNTIKRWLGKAQRNVVRKAYEERRRQAGLPPR